MAEKVQKACKQQSHMVLHLATPGHSLVVLHPVCVSMPPDRNAQFQHICCQTVMLQDGPCHWLVGFQW